MPTIYELQYHAEVNDLLERMRQKLAKSFGVTVQGNRCTLRWIEGNNLVSVHMIIAECVTPSESEESREQSERMSEFAKKHPEVMSDLHYAEMGEYSK